MNEAFDAGRVFLCSAFFIYASWSDLKTREVSNKVWVILAPSAFALTFSQFLLFAPDMLNTYAFSFVVTSAVSVALFYAGAFGGADAKALICLSLALPAHPTSLQPMGFISPLFPITVFCNAVLFAALSIFYTITRNLLWIFRTGKGLFEGFEGLSIGKRILTALCGYKVSITELKGKKHFYPLEDVQIAETGEIERNLLTFPSDEKKETMVGNILEASKREELQGEIWVTPGLPMLIFITVGLFVALIIGDIIWNILSVVL